MKPRRDPARRAVHVSSIEGAGPVRRDHGVTGTLSAILSIPEEDGVKSTAPLTRVRDRMTRVVATTHSEVPVMAAREVMRKRALRHLPVVDQRGRLVGIVTDRDLRQVVFAPTLRDRAPRINELLQALTVSDIMTRNVVAVRPGERIEHAARVMRERRLGALPVVERGRLVGILSEVDILAAFEEFFAGRRARPHAPPRVGRTAVRPLRSDIGAGGRYEYGLPVPDIHDPWEDQGAGN
jgi:CBS domain-containing protein